MPILVICNSQSAKLTGLSSSILRSILYIYSLHYGVIREGQGEKETIIEKCGACDRNMTATQREKCEQIGESVPFSVVC